MTQPFQLDHELSHFSLETSAVLRDLIQTEQTHDITIPASPHKQIMQHSWICSKENKLMTNHSLGLILGTPPCQGATTLHGIKGRQFWVWKPNKAAMFGLREITPIRFEVMYLKEID